MNPTTLLTLHRPPKVPEPTDLSALVVAASGGAAATTTAYGLATALRLGTGGEVCLVDATTDGGNLLPRAGSGPVDSARAIGHLTSTMATTSAGVVVVGDDGGLADPMLVGELFASRPSARLFDVGTALRSARLLRLVESGPPLVLVAPARAEPLARMRQALTWLMSTYGAQSLRETVVVISHQSRTPLIDDLPRLREALSPRLAGFVEVPFDPVLALPGALDHTRLAATTLNAWVDVLDCLGPLVKPAGSGNHEGAPT